ncbi:hypothetical protein SVIOM342S_07051 [Streptomyces violaceorubidus]
MTGSTAAFACCYYLPDHLLGGGSGDLAEQR